jgi:hypothetical protein
MKVVINRCFGGFGLSALGEKEYLKRKGKKSYFYKQKYESETYTKIKNVESFSGYFNTFTKDLGDKFKNFPKDDDIFFYSGMITDRSDPDLVAVVEKLGNKANGQCARLKIVEIPDNIKWEITDYDGMEEVEECHRSW